MDFFYTVLQTPFGEQSILTSGQHIYAASLPGRPDALSADVLPDTCIGIIQKGFSPLELDLKHAVKQIFNGSHPDNLQYKLRGTPFQVKVWKGLLDIPYGHVTTYGQLATKIGYPGAARAVGLACKKNPIALFIPCHRVVGSNGALTGYGGKAHIETKKMLLEMEKCLSCGLSSKMYVTPYSQ